MHLMILNVKVNQTITAKEEKDNEESLKLLND